MPRPRRLLETFGHMLQHTRSSIALRHLREESLLDRTQQMRAEDRRRACKSSATCAPHASTGVFPNDHRRKITGRHGIRRAPEQTREHILVELDYRGDNFVPLNRVRVSWSRRRVGAPRADAATGPKPPIEMTPKGSGANSHASREGREGLRNNQQKCLIRRVTNKFVAS